MDKEMNTLTETISKYRSEHYIHDFSLSDGYLVCLETREVFGPDEVAIECTGRYEGDSNPDDMSIIYGIITNSGIKGILIDAFGVYANPKISEFIKMVPVTKQNKTECQ